MKRKLLLLSLAACFIAGAVDAKSPKRDTSSTPRLRRFYVASAMDAAIFSTAFIQNTTYLPAGNVTSNSTGTLRFSAFFNFGATINYNFNRHLGIYTGLDIKNIGYISKDKSAGTTRKARTYNLGIPVGVKFGNMDPKKMYGFAGGGIDLALNYKEKNFKERKNKTKMNEWFSDRTPLLMPYVFAGVAFNRGTTLKVQYYPGNFVNSNFTMVSSGVAVQPYAGTTVHLLLLSVGFALPYGDRRDFMKHRVEEMQTK